MRADPSVLCSPPFHGGSGRPGARNSFAVKIPPPRGTHGCPALLLLRLPTPSRSTDDAFHAARFRAPCTSPSQCSRTNPLSPCSRASTRGRQCPGVGVRFTCLFGSPRAEAHLAPRVIRNLNPRPSRFDFDESTLQCGELFRSGVQSQRTPHKLVSKRILSRGGGEDSRRTCGCECPHVRSDRG